MRLRKDAKVELLRQVPLFAGCSKRELAAIADLASEVNLPEGHTLIREGAEAYSFFVLVEGTADVLQDDRKIAALRPGDFMGELALILRRPRTATVTLTSPARLLAVSAHNFRPLLERSPELQLELLETLAERTVAGSV